MALNTNESVSQWICGEPDGAIMDDEAAAAREKSVRPASRQILMAKRPAETAAVFDEETYLRYNPDVRAAVAGGAFGSGREHYERYGRAEGRPFRKIDPVLRNRVIISNELQFQREIPKLPPCAVESVRLSQHGGIFILGWVNDIHDPLDSVDLYFGGWSISFDHSTLARSRRVDAESAIGNAARHLFGFWGFQFAGRKLPGGQCSAVVRLQSGAETGFVIQAELLADHELRKIALGFLAGTTFFGNHDFEAAASIEQGIGAQLVELNRTINRHVIATPHVQRFGAGHPRYRGSLVVCLYGRAEYMFLQNAAFAGQAGIEGYEIIYVSNSPQIGEQLLREARLCSHIYGIDQTVIILSANAGYAAANNLAARHARSDRLMILNPDVFPRESDWIARHAALIAGLPPPQTTLFGAPLYYDDGSLMHAGMYFERDTVPSFADPKRVSRSLLRVAHFGRGAPPDSAGFRKSRPVPAVSGAFMSISRSWFEKLGGFNEDYIFGHYEDADLCLKSIRNGRLPWLHDIGLWHLEGKGSNRMRQHDGGSIVNRWLFTRTWREIVGADLLGPAPSRKVFDAASGLTARPAARRPAGKRVETP